MTAKAVITVFTFCIYKREMRFNIMNPLMCVTLKLNKPYGLNKPNKLITPLCVILLSKGFENTKNNLTFGQNPTFIIS